MCRIAFIWQWMRFSELSDHFEATAGTTAQHLHRQYEAVGFRSGAVWRAGGFRDLVSSLWWEHTRRGDCRAAQRGGLEEWRRT